MNPEASLVGFITLFGIAIVASIVIGGEGFVDVVERQGDELRRLDRIATRAGARTGLWVAFQAK